jgi:cell wall-associated NlpC family hydrolase
MTKRSRTTSLVSVLLSLALLTSCSADRQQPGVQQQQVAPPAPIDDIRMNQTQPSDFKALSTPNESKQIPIRTINNTQYVSIKELVDALQFNSEWDAASKTYQIGDYGTEYELTIGSNQATREGDPISLGSPTILEGDTAYIPVGAVADLFKDDMGFTIGGSSIMIQPTGDATIGSIDTDEQVSPELDFADDEEDPFKGEDIGEETEATFSSQDVSDEEAVTVMKNINMNELLRKSKKYLGVKYKFGTGPYPQTGRFDCSTFTRYLYDKYGVHLKRTARAQANMGNFVSRKKLRKGDLMFFYVPGRFKSNRIVGHVGIYMGKQKMIHASPEPKNGVQISNIDKAYWKRTFLRAKRIAL